MIINLPLGKKSNSTSSLKSSSSFIRSFSLKCLYKTFSNSTALISFSSFSNKPNAAAYVPSLDLPPGIRLINRFRLNTNLCNIV